MFNVVWLDCELLMLVHYDNTRVQVLVLVLVLWGMGKSRQWVCIRVIPPSTPSHLLAGDNHSPQPQRCLTCI